MGTNSSSKPASAAPSGAMVEENWKGTAPKTFALIRVPDTLAGYQNLAANYRKSLPLKVIAITGSNGKTSTKDFVAATLSRGFRVTKTEGNFNNHVGLPQTMLAATSERRDRRLGNRDESSRRNRRAGEDRRAGCGDHHEHRCRAYRIHGQPRSDRRGKRRSGGSGRRRRDGDFECGRSV